MNHPLPKKFPVYALFFAASFFLSQGCVDAFDWFKTGQIIGGPETLSEFEVPPKDPQKNYLEFIALGCSGTGASGQKKIAGAMAEWTEKEDISFVLYLGDNIYTSGVKSVEDRQWKKKFEDIYWQESLQIPFYAVLGNHDHRGNIQAQIDYSQKSSRWNMPDRYYSFEKKLEDGTTVGFFGIDTTPMYKKSDTEQLDWLERELKASKARWKVVFGHAALFSGDEERGPETPVLRKMLLPILNEGGADLYVTAHSHSLEVMKPVGGTHFLVSGAGAWLRRKIYWTEDTLFAGGELAFSWIRVSNDLMELILMGPEDKVYYVHTISK